MEWRGRNPYFSMLANADSLVASADSVSMVGESVATGAPVYVFAPIGGHRKIADYLARLERLGAVRPWNGTIERWRYEPINSTPSIAASILTAYETFRGLTPPLPPPEAFEDEEDGEEYEDDDCEPEDMLRLRPARRPYPQEQASPCRQPPLNIPRDCAGVRPAGYTAAIYAARAMRGADADRRLRAGRPADDHHRRRELPRLRPADTGPWLMDQMRAQAEHVGAKLVSITSSRRGWASGPSNCLAIPASFTPATL